MNGLFSFWGIYYPFTLCTGFLIALNPVPLSTCVSHISFIFILFFFIYLFPSSSPFNSFLVRGLYLSLPVLPCRSAFWYVCPALLHVCIYWFPSSVTGPHRLRVGLNCLGEQAAANFHGAEYLSYLCGDEWLYAGYVIAQISLVLCVAEWSSAVLKAVRPYHPLPLSTSVQGLHFVTNVSEFRVFTQQRHFDRIIPLLKFTLVHIRFIRLFLGASLNWQPRIVFV
jgi:hypothetical protein